MSSVRAFSHDPDMARPVPVSVKMDQSPPAHLTGRFPVFTEQIEKLQRLSIEDRLL